MSPGSSPPPAQKAPPPDYGKLYADYSGWESDITQRRDRSLRSLDFNFKRGAGISAEAYVSERSRIERESEGELKELRSGPTFQMLRENWRDSGTRKTFDQFYGGRQQVRSTPGAEQSEAMERGPSPRRGPTGSGLAEAEGLLERQQATWFYV